MQHRKISDTINEFINGKRILFILTCLSWLILIGQIVMIMYFNLFEYKYHLGFDASSTILKARMIGEQKTLFPNYYVDQTSLLLHTQIPFVALVYRITKNIFFSYGIVNVFLTIIMVLLVLYIFNKLNVGWLYAGISSNLLLAPYTTPEYNVANPLDYFSMMYFSSASYLLTVITLLCICIIIIHYKIQQKSFIRCLIKIVTFFLLFFAGLSAGYSMLVYAIVPLLLYVLMEAIIYEDIRQIINKRTLWIICSFVTIVFGKWVATVFFEFTSKESGMQILALTDFLKNLGNIFLGLGKLFNVLSQNSKIDVFSYAGVNYLFNMAIFALYLLGIIGFYVQNKEYTKESASVLRYIICFIWINIGMFAILDSTYGAVIFEERYLILFFVFSLFTFGIFIGNIKNNFMRNVLCLVIVILTISSSVMGYKNLSGGRSTICTDLAKITSKYQVELVYGWSDGDDDITIFMRNLRVLDEQKIYKAIGENGIYHWGDYTYYDDLNSFDEALFLVMKDDFFDIPEYYKCHLEYQESYGDIDIYYIERNVLDFVIGLPEEGSSIDFLYADAITKQNCTLNSAGNYQTDGTPGVVIYGPYAPTRSGKYRITLHYEVLEALEEYAGVFEIPINLGTEILGYVNLDSGGKAFIEVEFEEGHAFEYRLHVYEGTILEIKYIEIEKLE